MKPSTIRLCAIFWIAAVLVAPIDYDHRHIIGYLLTALALHILIPPAKDPKP